MSSIVASNKKSLPGAWKPGNPNPSGCSTTATSSSTSVKIHEKSKKGHQSISPTTAATDSSSPAKKTLSGTTMNMRFMQRRRELEEAELSRKRKSAQQEQEMNESVNQGLTDIHYRISKDNNTTLLTNVTTNSLSSNALQTKELNSISTATNTDMHGSDIIGRRSFGGFNKSVGETWEAAVTLLFKDSLTCNNNKNGNNNKSTISDEELLCRYKTCISGDTNYYDKNKESSRRRSSGYNEGHDGTPKIGRPIGNLDATVRKRKKSF